MPSQCLSKSKSKNANFEPSYQCRTCKKSFKKFISFEGHFAFNALCRVKSGWFMQCYLCGQRFHYLADLKYHQRQHINRKTELKPIETVNRSIEKNVSTCSFKCSICQCAFSTKVYLNEHMVLHSKNTTTISDSPINATVKIECSSSIALEKHKAIQTKGNVICNKCNRSFTTDNSLSFHQKLFHQSNTTNKPKGNKISELKCNICNAKFSCSQNLKRHKLVHTIGEEECEICHIKSTKRSLELHERDAHPELMDSSVPDEVQPDKGQNDEANSQIVSRITRETTPSITSPSTSSTSSPQITYICEQCGESIPSIHHLHLHHCQYSSKICDKQHKTVAGRKIHHPRTFECYICKNDFRSARKLTVHVTKHIVYEQWVDPIDVYLPNWDPKQSREILENQPLVWVENLNIKKINLNFSVGRDKSTEIESSVEVKDEIKVSSDQARPSIIEKIKREYEVEGSESPDSSQMNINQSDTKPTYYDKEKIKQKLSDCVIDLSDDNDEVLIEEQQHDITTTYVAGNKEVINISSESDVKDIDLFHCYFCDETFRSLDVLGVHVKKCSFCP